MKKLKSGLHIAIVTNRAPGHGGSLFAWESYISCKLNGIRAILVTFHNHRIYPEIGADLRYISLPNQKTEQNFSDSALSSLHDFAIEAEDQSKFLIIDLHAGLFDDDVVFSVLASAGIAGACSVTELMPMRHGQHARFIDLVDGGITVSRRLYRNWGFRSDLGETIPPNTPLVHHWNPAFLSSSVLNLIFQSGCQGVPSTNNSTTDKVSEPLRPDEVENRYDRHIADAITNIWEHVLNPISDDFKDLG